MSDESAPERNLLIHQIRITDRVVRMNVEGLGHDDSLRPPPGGGNCLNWVLGHLLLTWDLLLPIVGGEAVLGQEALERYSRGTEGLGDPAEATAFGELVEAWAAASDRMAAAVQGLSAAELDRPAPFSPGNDPNETVRSLLTLSCFHQAYHAGQTGILRRFLGRDGAIP